MRFHKPDDGYIVSPHAALRYAGRVMGYAKPAKAQLDRARTLLLKELETAECTHRYRADKARVMKGASGAHYLVYPGGVVRTTLKPGWAVPKCPCMDCVRAKAARLKEKKR